LKLLLDNNLAPRIARSLNALYDGEHKIVALRDLFLENTADVVWINKLSDDRGWAVVTQDLHIRTRPHERAALDKANIVFFFLASGWKTFKTEETAVRIIRSMPKMIAQVALTESGRFELPVNARSKLRSHRK
jgi:PIN like domain